MAQGVDVTTAKLGPEWRDHLVRLPEPRLLSPAALRAAFRRPIVDLIRRAYQLRRSLRGAYEVDDNWPDGPEPDDFQVRSASILGTFPETMLPDAATRSDEADIASIVDDDGSAATRIDGGLGELSPFDRTNGYYGQESTSRLRSCRLSGAIASSFTGSRRRHRDGGCVSSDTTASHQARRVSGQGPGVRRCPDLGGPRQLTHRSRAVRPRSRSSTRGCARECSPGCTRASRFAATIVDPSR